MTVRVYPIEPVPAPRMTRADAWRARPCVVRYRAFRDQVRQNGIEIPAAGATVEFVLPMPASWSRAKRERMAGQAHQHRPDVDNLGKALLDACHREDAHVWDIRIRKTWGAAGEIRISDPTGQ